MPWSARTLKPLRRFAGVAFLLGCVLSQGGCGRIEGGRRPESETDAAPDFALKVLGGAVVRLGDFRGKVVLLDFWATWCGPCQDSIPYYERIYERHRSQGFTVLGIDEDAMTEVVGPFVRQNKVAYPILLDPEGRAVEAYGVRGFPTAFLIDAEGRIRGQWIGFDENVAEDMERSLSQLLPLKKS